VRGHHRVIAFRHQNKLSVAHCERFVNAAVSGIDLLNRKTFRALDAVVVNLFEVHFRGRVIDIVFVGRKAGPIALGREDLHHQQAMRGKLRRNHGMNLARGVAAAANFDAHLVRRHQPRGMFFFSAAVAKGQVAIAIGHNREAGFQRQIKRVGKAFEYGLAPADAPPLAPRALNRADASEHHDGQLIAAGFCFVSPALRQLAGLEGQVLVAEVFDAVPEGFRTNQQVSHHLTTGNMHTCSSNSL